MRLHANRCCIVPFLSLFTSGVPPLGAPNRWLGNVATSRSPHRAARGFEQLANQWTVPKVGTIHWCRCCYLQQTDHFRKKLSTNFVGRPGLWFAQPQPLGPEIDTQGDKHVCFLLPYRRFNAFDPQISKHVQQKEGGHKKLGSSANRNIKNIEKTRASNKKENLNLKNK